MDRSFLLPKIASGKTVAGKKTIGKAVAIDDNLPAITLSTSRVPSRNPYHLDGCDQTAARGSCS